jgi:hypothetical protein
MTTGNYGQPEGSGQPYGQQPPPAPGGYGQPPQAAGGGYGQPPQYGGYGAPAGNPYADVSGRNHESFGVVSAVVVAIGAVLGIVAFTAVDWFSGGSSKFSAVRKVVTDDATKDIATGVSKVYFGWLAWVLLAVVVVTGLAAALPNAGRPFRVIAPVLAIGSIVVTFIALQLLKSNVSGLPSRFDGYSQYIKHARVGFWIAVAAFLIVGIGAAIGARRNRG